MYGCTFAINASEVRSMEKKWKSTFPTQGFIAIFYHQTRERKCQPREYNEELVAAKDGCCK